MPGVLQVETVKLDRTALRSDIAKDVNKLAVLWSQVGDIHFDRNPNALTYNIGVVGSRSFKDRALLWDTMERICLMHLEQRICIVSGGAKGADTLASEFADENHFDMMEFLPDWEKHGKKAGMIRNVEIVKNSHEVVAFWDGKSRGTACTIYLCRTHAVPVTIIQTENPLHVGYEDYKAWQKARISACMKLDM